MTLTTQRERGSGVMLDFLGESQRAVSFPSSHPSRVGGLQAPFLPCDLSLRSTFLPVFMATHKQFRSWQHALHALFNKRKSVHMYPW